MKTENASGIDALTIDAPGMDASGAAEGAARTTVGYLTDSHAHLSEVLDRVGSDEFGRVIGAYESAREKAPEAALAPFILDMGLDPGDLAVRLARFSGYDCVRFAAGIWPGKAAFGVNAGEVAGAPSCVGALSRTPQALPVRPGNDDSILALLEADSDDGACVAIGECGLDYHHMEAPPERQIALFRAQAELAERRGLPLIVHSRLALGDSLAVVADFSRKIPVVIHCFSYDAEAAARFLACGCYLSFAGNLSYKKSQGIREALACTPPDRLLLETDAPYMNPEPRRGRPSTSCDIVRTLAVAAEIRGEHAGELADTVNRNAAALFGARRR